MEKKSDVNMEGREKRLAVGIYNCVVVVWTVKPQLWCSSRPQDKTPRRSGEEVPEIPEVPCKQPNIM